ncbi:MAG: hypothetical protein H7301_04305 [Cryobacterium sp.]|nr:hypothetical protein [Oligoflexia bacterium]
MKNLSKEFRKELANAIRLSVFLTALVFGFLVLQNRTVSPEEVAVSSPESNRRCIKDPRGNRVPASVDSSPESRIPCDRE